MIAIAPTVIRTNTTINNSIIEKPRSSPPLSRAFLIFVDCLFTLTPSGRPNPAGRASITEHGGACHRPAADGRNHLKTISFAHWTRYAHR